MNVTQFLELLKNSDKYQEQIVHIEHLPSREAQYGDNLDLPSCLWRVLAEMGISELYTHQVDVIEAVHSGRNVVIVTDTASGKTLGYNLPVLQAFLERPQNCALYIFPTKALSQDQLRVVRSFAEISPEIDAALDAEIYDGDTPKWRRRNIRQTVNLLLSNPDMLHLGILPHHSMWSRFFENLRYVVLDEMHTYRGIFGSNVANVMRRLRRICSYYGSEPQFICCSATIANPAELAEKLIGRTVELIDNDGSPKGAKHFVFWNPPYIDETKSWRRSPNTEAQELMTNLITNRIQTIAFTRARVVAELIYRYVRDSLHQIERELVDSIRAYRAGYLPKDRREIEKALFSGQLLGVTSTTALELGIDIGSLDACLLVGFPGTIASLWQQAGRAGRQSDDSLAVLIAHNEPVEQFIMRHPEYIFEKSPENAIIDPENIYVLVEHLRCAAYEIPMSEHDGFFFGDLTLPLLDLLCEYGDLTQIRDRCYWAQDSYPAAETDIRAISNESYRIIDGSTGELLGSVDYVNGLAMVYPGAIYMHEGETYIVHELSLEEKEAIVEPVDVDYYTQPCFREHISIDTEKEEKNRPDYQVKLGEVTVTRKTVGFTRIKFYSLENLGYEELELPEQNLKTIALWIIPSTEILEEVKSRELKPEEGLEGIKNVLAVVLPIYVMADSQSIRGKVQRLPSGETAIFIYDAYPGGLGFAEKGYELIEEIISHAYQIIAECDCSDGCPSCVRPTSIALREWTEPDKSAALAILEMLIK